MSDPTITETDVEAVATKLDALREHLTDQEYATLQEVFRLAGSGLALATDAEVSGFMRAPALADATKLHDHHGGLRAQFSLGLTVTPAPPNPLPIPYPNQG